MAAMTTADVATNTTTKATARLTRLPNHFLTKLITPVAQAQEARHGYQLVANVTESLTKAGGYVRSRLEILLIIVII